MKKKLAVVIIVLLYAVSIASLAGAVTLTDVPANHWAYLSVNKLVKAGIVEGYSDNTFKGEKPLTRYEFAVAVAKAVDNYNKADENAKSEILKLVAEFSKELKDIGARLGAVERKVGNVKFGGDARIRYQENSGLQGTSKGDQDVSRIQSRIRLTGDAVLDDNWTVSTRFGVQNITAQSDKDTYGSNNGQVFFDRAEFKYKKGNYAATIGRSTLFLGQGTLYDFAFDGFSASVVSGKFSGKALIGDASLTTSVWGQYVTGAQASTNWNKTEKFWAIDTKYGFDKNISATATLYRSISDAYLFKDVALGVNATSGEFTLQAEGVKNTAATKEYQNKGFWADVRWKVADVNKPGTWALNTRYMAIGKNAIDSAPTTLNYSNTTNGLKGYEVGLDYVFAKGAHVKLHVGKYKPYDTNYSKFNSYNTAYTLATFFVF